MKQQPIESAPKDGTRILLFGGSYRDASEPGGEVLGPMVARWFDRGDREPAGCWLVADIGESFHFVEYTDPTHWLPLDSLETL